ncbi:ankyrin repeat-containing domain protein [Fusarium redolens]|uniref:Ankyrin repeat-containing domain protein n=1 Tax=Fusarium redolens TaxID=48865 RepID=A0A9P9JK40_FUSRE|nr:ankyrin repeat-containing domain protein [Fusarium redolens]KAH7204891.1 ankyrin repeat-containing domain protein [Fusarium redolens]
MHDHGLVVLAPLPPNGPHTVDIVMVHGLNGNRTKTWTQDGCCWPRDLLPKKIPTARVLTFGYDASFARNYSTYGIREHATMLLARLRDNREERDDVDRPLIFVCHSLGGIVVKQALLIASIDQAYSSISRSTTGIVFMGTPHRGSSVADWGSILAGIARIMFLKPKRQLLDDLRSNSRTLSDISEDFLKIVSRYSIKSFYEENKMKNLVMVVSKDSATMKITQEEAIPIEGEHKEICKFYGADDARFTAVCNAIRRLVPQEENKPLTAEQVNILKSLPGPNVYEILETVEEPCQGTTDWVLSNPQFTEWLTSTESHVLHVVGKPGSGKSVLAAFLFQSGMRQVLNHHAFYFAFGDGRCAAAAWASLAHQMLLEDSSLFSKVFTQPGQSRRFSAGLDAKVWTASRLKQIFERLLLEFRHSSVYIIDALDQCDETMEKFVASFTAATQGHAAGKVKLLVLSRQGLASSNLTAEFLNLMSFDLDDQIEHGHAIRTAIKQKVDELCRRRGCQQLADTITEKLSLTAQGMYLLPMMTVSLLKKIHATHPNIMEELNSFPEDLMAAYRKALDNVKEDDRQLAASLLLWVVFAVRPLNIRELSSVIALDDTMETGWDIVRNTSFDLLGTAGVIDLLGPILKVSKSNGNFYISLIHHSTREFFLSSNHAEDSSRGSGPPRWIVEAFQGSKRPLETAKELPSRANRTLANRCFQYYYLTTQSNTKMGGERIRGMMQYISLGRRAELNLNIETHSPLDLDRRSPEDQLVKLEDERIYNTILKSQTSTQTASTTTCTETLESDAGPLLQRKGLFMCEEEAPMICSAESLYHHLELSLGGPRFPTREMPWHQMSAAIPYKFKLPSELVRGQDKDSEVGMSLGDDVFEEFPALKYCIENLPEHVRLVESSNIPFHRSFAAFLHSKLGGDWIYSFWATRDPEQEYGRQHALHFASTLGLEPEVKSLLASGISVNQRDQYGNTALDVATSTGVVDIIRLLYDIGQADIHARQMVSSAQNPALPLQNNVLHTAVWYGHKDATAYLLSVGAKVLVPDLRGCTPLDIAVDARNSQLVKLLMDEPSTLEVIHFAAKRGRLETLKWLIEEENVDPCIKTFQGNTSLHIAAQHNQAACVQYLAPITLSVPEHVYNQDGLHAFHIAARSEARDVLEVFISRRFCDINIVDTNSRTALHHACLAGKAAAVAFLILKGVDTARVDTNGYTALELFLAEKRIRYSNQQRREIMIAFNDPRMRDNQPRKGGNLLHVALEASPPEQDGDLPEGDAVIEILLDWGLNPYETDSTGSTALHLAAVWGGNRLLRLLEVCDCVNIQNHLGQTPLHVLLTTRSSSRVSTDSAKALLDRGTNLELQDHKGRTAVHYAVHQSEAVFVLVTEQGKALNLQDNEGKTPLHILMGSPYWEVPSQFSKLLRLIEGGADLQIQDKHKRTPLDTYIWRVTESDSKYDAMHDEVLTILVKHGCKLVDYSEATRVTLLRKLVLRRFMDDARLVLASLSPLPPDVSLEMPEKASVGITGIDPELLFKNVSENDKADFLQFLVSNGASDDQILPFFKLFNETDFTINQPKRSERFKGELRLAVRLAIEREHAGIVAFMEGVVLQAAITNDLPTLRSFVEDFGANAEAVDPWNRTVLSLAAERGNLDMVQYLLSRNVPTESLDNFGRTALYWAARSGRLDVVKALAEHGAILTDFAVEVGAVYGYEAITGYLREFVKLGDSS